MNVPKLVYIIPVHNEEAILASKLEPLIDYLAASEYPAAEVLLVENGSTDASWAIAQELERDTPVRVRAFTEPNAGIGYAYDRGLREAIELFGPSTERFAVLTAADLPFGTSDLEAARKRMESQSARMLMGSKAHPDTEIELTPLRQLTTLGYKMARRVVVGMRVGDSQGSMFVRLDLAADIVTQVTARDFFYSTEFCYRVERGGNTIIEVPIKVVPEVRPSTVRPLKHGSQMAVALWGLRREKPKQ